VDRRLRDGRLAEPAKLERPLQQLVRRHLGINVMILLRFILIKYNDFVTIYI
jgi:hypothetical protein